MRLHGVVVG